MVTILTSIYETLYQCEPEDINVPLCVDLCLIWLLNVFDGQRTGLVRVLSFKLGLVILCRGPLNEKYGVMFNLAAGGLDKKEILLDQKTNNHKTGNARHFLYFKMKQKKFLPILSFEKIYKTRLTPLALAENLSLGQGRV